MDLFGPFPSKNHIVVIQDLASRYPIAKVVRSINAKSVIPVLEDTFNTFSNPQCQKSDNSPLFNSKEMLNFISKRDIKQVKIPPDHPSANNVETLMKTLGKAMKIGHFQNRNQAKIFNYKDTSHLSTCVVPAHMLFRDEYRSHLSHKSIIEENELSARNTDNCIKTQQKFDYSSLENVRPCNFEIEDNMLVRNYKKSTKYDPFYLPNKFQVTDILAKTNVLLAEDPDSGVYFKRYLNNLNVSIKT